MCISVLLMSYLLYQNTNVPLRNNSFSTLLQKVKNNATNIHKRLICLIWFQNGNKNFYCHNPSFCLLLIMRFSQSKSVFCKHTNFLCVWCLFSFNTKSQKNLVTHTTKVIEAFLPHSYCIHKEEDKFFFILFTKKSIITNNLGF